MTCEHRHRREADARRLRPTEDCCPIHGTFDLACRGCRHTATANANARARPTKRQARKLRVEQLIVRWSALLRDPKGEA